MPTYYNPEDGDPTALAQLEANAAIMENEPDDLPVLVYRTRHMTDEQAAAIQDFAHKVMTRV